MSRKGLLIFENPVIKKVIIIHAIIKALIIEKNLFLLWLNRPQL